jgi:hypothetical protein
MTLRMRLASPALVPFCSVGSVAPASAANTDS